MIKKRKSLENKSEFNIIFENLRNFTKRSLRLLSFRAGVLWYLLTFFVGSAVLPLWVSTSVRSLPLNHGGEKISPN